MKLYQKVKKASQGVKFVLVGEGEIISKTEHFLVLQSPNYALSVGYKDLQTKDYVLKYDDGSIYEVAPLPTEKQVMSAIADKTKTIVPEDLKTETELSKRRSEKAKKGWQTRREQKEELKTVSVEDAEIIKTKMKKLAQQARKLILEAEKLHELSQELMNGD